MQSSLAFMPLGVGGRSKKKKKKNCVEEKPLGKRVKEAEWKAEGSEKEQE